MRKLLVASALVHLALFAWALRDRPVAPPSVAAIANEEQVTIEMETDPSVAPAPSAEAPRVAMTEQGAVRAALRVESPPTSSPIVEAVPETAPYSSNSTMIVFAPSVAIMGAGAANPFLVRGVGDAGGGGVAGVTSADPMYIPENKRAEQAVKDALRARDQSIGLGLEGPVVHALEDATHAGFAPEHGTATFLAVIDERGIVIDLKVLASTASSSSAAKGWEDVRARAVRSLATAKIDLRGVKRAELKIAVESDVRLPSGGDPKKAPIKPVANPTAMKVETAAPPSPGGSDVVAGAEVAQFDVADIGAKGQHVVHAHVVLITTR